MIIFIQTIFQVVLIRIGFNFNDFNRVAVKVLGFHDLTIHEKLLKGPVDMEIRHLGCQGYKVLTVSLKKIMLKLNLLTLFKKCVFFIH